MRRDIRLQGPRMRLRASWSRAGPAGPRPTEMVLQTDIEVLDSSEGEEVEEQVVIMKEEAAQTDEPNIENEELGTAEDQAPRPPKPSAASWATPTARPHLHGTVPMEIDNSPEVTPPASFAFPPAPCAAVTAHTRARARVPAPTAAPTAKSRSRAAPPLEVGVDHDALQAAIRHEAGTCGGQTRCDWCRLKKAATQALYRQTQLPRFYGTPLYPEAAGARDGATGAASAADAKAEAGAGGAYMAAPSCTPPQPPNRGMEESFAACDR